MFNMFIADVADYNEWKGFKRMEGSMGILMSLSGYVSGATVDKQMPQIHADLQTRAEAAVAEQ